MVEKKEFAILFIKKKIDEVITEFIPYRVVEGTYDKDNNWFNDTQDGIQYLHIEITPSSTVGYGLRTVLELMPNSISKTSIEQIKQEILDYAKQFKYERDLSRNDFILVTNNETGEKELFKDIDNMPEFTRNKQGLNEETGDILLMTPGEIEEEVKKTIKGQDEAIRKIVTALWTTINFREMRKKNMLLIGPTGVGKTAIFEKLKEILKLPVVIFSIPGLSQAGYVGRSVDEILKQVYYEADMNEELAEKSIVILDEIDKIAAQGREGVSTIGVQNELLKIVEGCERYIESHNPQEPSFTIDTSNMIFVGTGAFQELFEKVKPQIGYSSQPKTNEKKTLNAERIINYGLKRELVGRLPILVELKNLGKKELIEIITQSDESELNATINALQLLNVEIENLDEVIELIAEDALNKQIGARGLIFTINNIFQEIFYEVGNNPGIYERVIVGKNIIQDPFDFELVNIRTKKRVKVKNNKGVVL